MKEVLKRHLAKYPQMQIQDVVKLLYQSEFGGGHMIASQEESLKRLRREVEEAGLRSKTIQEPMPGLRAGSQVPSKSGTEVPWEDIGGGMCRIDLSALGEGLSAWTLNRMFVQTANCRRGTVEGFERKLELLLAGCREQEFPFGERQVLEYLETYKKQGYPPVSHTKEYRERYHPSYRVADRMYGQYYKAFLAMDQVLKEAGWDPLDTGEAALRGLRSPVNVAIDGMCGSGKTTLARLLAQVYGGRLFHMDDFFLQPYQRTPERLGEPGGNVDYERFQAEVLEHLGDREGLHYRRYDCGRQELAGEIYMPYCWLNLVEGTYSHHPYFGDIYDLRLFCRVEEQEQLRRIGERDGEKMLERFRKEWIPMEHFYFQACRIEERAVTVPVTIP